MAKSKRISSSLITLHSTNEKGRRMLSKGFVSSLFLLLVSVPVVSLSKSVEELWREEQYAGVAEQLDNVYDAGNVLGENEWRDFIYGKSLYEIGRFKEFTYFIEQLKLNKPGHKALDDLEYLALELYATDQSAKELLYAIDNYILDHPQSVYVASVKEKRKIFERKQQLEIIQGLVLGKKFNEARMLLDDYAKSFPKHNEHKFWEVKIVFEEGSLIQAFKMAEELRSIHPGESFADDLMLLQAYAAEKAGKINASAKILDEFAKKYPDHPSSKPEGLYAKAVLDYYRRQHGSSLNRLKNLIERFPDFHRREHAEYMMGKIMYENSDIQGFLTLYNTVTETNKDHRARDDFERMLPLPAYTP